jgi:putative aldouronate transport system substrate-binding protein
MKEKLAQGKYFAYMHSNTKGLNEFMSDNNKRDASQGYIAIDGPKNSKGDKSTFTGGSIGGWTNTFITKKTEEPQKAMELITYLTSKYGNMVTTFGIEGETYDLVDGKVKYSKETEDLKNSDIAKFDKTVGLGSYWFTTDSAYTLSMGEEPATSIRQMVDWASDKMEPRFEIEDIDPTPGTSLARNLTTINTNRVQAIVKVFEAKTEKEGKEIWDAFLTSRDNDNFEAITKERNKNMEENINRLK